MKIYSPESIPSSSSLEYAKRPARIEGLRIGLLDNTKAPVDKMMRYLERRLRETVPGALPFHIAKNAVNRSAEPEILEALAKNADVVITALGS